MVSGRCQRNNCGFRFDDAEHMDDAIAKLQAHYRMEHPTKAFYKNHYLEDIEGYNNTLDEQIGRHLGMNDWRERLENGDRNNRLQARHIVSACQQIVRHHQHYAPNVVDEALALSREYGTRLDDPRLQDANANNAQNNAPGPLVAQFLEDQMLIDVVPEEEPF